MAKLKELLHSDGLGFTLIELLIVSSILGIISAITLPNVSGFLNTSNLAAANAEVAAVKTAGDCYYTNNLAWPSDSSNLAIDGFLDKPPEETYSFDTTNGNITGIASSGKWIDAGLSFNSTCQQWE